MATLIGEHHPVALAAPLVETECAKIYPSAGTHLLVDAEGGGTPLVIDGVLCIGHIVAVGRIAHINGILPRLGQQRLISDVALGLVGGLSHSCRAYTERVHAVGAERVEACKSRLVGFLPTLPALPLGIDRGRAAVVVDHHFVRLPVALPWGKHVGPCTLEHGDEIRCHDGLGEQVFVGAKQVGALPQPFVLLLVIIASVT